MGWILQKNNWCHLWGLNLWLPEYIHVRFPEVSRHRTQVSSAELNWILFSLWDRAPKDQHRGHILFKGDFPILKMKPIAIKQMEQILQKHNWCHLWGFNLWLPKYMLEILARSAVIPWLAMYWHYYLILFQLWYTGLAKFHIESRLFLNNQCMNSSYHLVICSGNSKKIENMFQGSFPIAKAEHFKFKP